jgi:uncharacterized protein YbjT (DUF2867 family)
MPGYKNKDRLILVTGATGQQGGAVLRHLRERGFSVRALVRAPDQPKAHELSGHGVEVVRGDMDDELSLTRAMDGLYGVFSLQTPYQSGTEGEIRQGVNVAEAANRSRISHFVYSSVGSAGQRTGIPHFDSKYRIEQHIRAKGMHFTIVRPVFFMENWLGMRQNIENGTINLPLQPETRLQMIAVDDIGGIVANTFEHPGKWQDREFEIAGDELSMADVARNFTRITGRDVRYVQTPWDEFEKQVGKDVTSMFRWFESTGYHVDTSAVRLEYPKLMNFDRWANTYWHTGTRTAR